MSEDQGSQKYNPREFYETNHRSNELRDVCVEITKRILGIVGTPDISKDQINQTNSELEQLEGKLIDLGITPDMQTGRKPSDYFTDNVVAAEYVAGQLLGFLEEGPKIQNIDSIKGHIGEFNTHDNFIEQRVDPKKNKTYTLETKDQNKKTRDWSMAAAVGMTAKAWMDMSKDELLYNPTNLSGE